MRTTMKRGVLVTLTATLGLVSACGGSDDADSDTSAAASSTEASATSDEPTDTADTADSTATSTDDSGATEGTEAVEVPEGATKTTMWYHGAGNEVESELIGGIIDDYNGSQSDCFVVREDFPQEQYNESITAAAIDGSLPDIIDVDGPVMPNWAWAGYLQPLTVPADKYANFLPGTIGEWNGEVYSVGLWDAATAMYARKSVLEANNIRIPTLDEPWTKDEFDAALETLKATGEYEYAFDPGLAWTGEWYPYAYLPWLESAGGQLIEAPDYQTAEGVFNGPEAVEFAEWWQSLFTRELAPGTAQDSADRETGFIDGKYALQWNGNWAAIAALESIGDDLIFLPAPDFGNGPKIGAASWQFGVSATSENTECANGWIEFALQDKYLAAFSDGIGLIPSTPTAAEMTENYKAGGPLEVFFELSEKQAVKRPVTPAYLNAALVFEKSFADITNGSEVQQTLDTGTDDIDQNIEQNKGYEPGSN